MVNILEPAYAGFNICEEDYRCMQRVAEYINNDLFDSALSLIYKIKSCELREFAIRRLCHNAVGDNFVFSMSDGDSGEDSKSGIDWCSCCGNYCNCISAIMFGDCCW